jgi:hypothetical protein
MSVFAKATASRSARAAWTGLAIAGVSTLLLSACAQGGTPPAETEEPTEAAGDALPIEAGERDLMLGSRFLGDPLAGGMPKWKYVANRFLTAVENVAFGLRLSEYHTGLRAYSRSLLETIPFERNSDDFVFDQELIAQVVAAGKAGRIGEIAVPTRYFAEASSVGFRRSVVYGLSTLEVVGRYLLHRMRLKPSRKLVPRRRP